MKKYIKIILLALCALPTVTSAQLTNPNPATPIGNAKTLSWFRGYVEIDSNLTLPLADTLGYSPYGSLRIRPQDGNLYYHNGIKWLPLRGSNNDVVNTPNVYYLSQRGVPDDADLSMTSNIDGTDGNSIIQALLDSVASTGGGIIHWNTHTSVSGNLKIGSNTIIFAHPGCGAKLISGSSRTMFRNANYVFGRSDSTKIIDKNISIVGGIWNGNAYFPNGASNQEKYTNPLGLTNIFSFYGVDNLTVRDAALINQKVYAISANTIYKGLYENLIVKAAFPYTGGGAINADGIHFDGWSENCVIRNCTIRAIDDAIGLNADDQYNYPDAIPGYVSNIPVTANGPIRNIWIENNTIDSGLYGLSLRSGQKLIDGIYVSGLHGNTSGYAVIADNYRNSPSHFDFPGPGNFGHITLDNVTVNILNPSYVTSTVMLDGNFEEVVVSNMRRNGFATGTTPSLTYDGGGKVLKSLIVSDYQSETPNGVLPLHFAVFNGEVFNAQFNNCRIKKVGASIYSPLVLAGGGIIYRLGVTGGYFENINNIVEIDQGAAVEFTNVTGGIHLGVEDEAAVYNVSNTAQNSVCVSGYSGYLPALGKFNSTCGDAFKQGGVVPSVNYLPGFVPVSFPVSTNLSKATSGVWQGSSGAGYGHTGLSNAYLPAGRDGAIAIKLASFAGNSAYLGFNTSNANQGSSGMEAGIVFDASPYQIYKVDNGATALIPGANGTIGQWLVCRRTGATIKAQLTSDGITFTDLYTYTFSSTADLYINCDVKDATNVQQLQYPQLSIVNPETAAYLNNFLNNTVFKKLPEYANDAAASAGGIQVGQFYRTGSFVKQRID